ncbi:MAG TPA: choice-of-anchor tandem repeat GloVer-containing protein [Ideonella sp.]|uniref:choice-of-anchor tandem repeat GloVer-containing protein n=1 Tax=Ideonella sp. TaxID=1929293 RepID=UPI002E2EF43F|nr:choice-of-anchor tandem repeat GloVer-containing protein [Ideonella sp.]HEX5688092.1 choice-of-anchor tandem repeat GloVer-containing protein [Ideonella sp.]
MKNSNSARIASLVLTLAATSAMAAGEFTILHQFPTTEASNPNPLIQGSDGNYYGTAIQGGALNWYGSVYRMTPAGTVTVLHSFNGADGGQPRGTLVDGFDGYYYGTTSTGGMYGGGTAFKISPAGAFTVTHHFKGSATEGSAPQCISNGNDGNFYGVTMFSGANDKGTVFRLSRSGAVTTVASFNGTNGSMPANCLTHTGDGIFYGVTTNGGANSAGVVFKVATSGGLTPIYSFISGGTGGASPTGPLERGSDGNFYGTTQSGGAKGYGTVYRVSKTGAVSWLYSFTGGADGGMPKGGVTMANNFAYYGTTSYGAAGGSGTTFKISTAGALTTLHAFTAAEGGRPSAHLLLDTAGKLIGTTNPGSTGGGAAFRQNP